jgi:chaperonin GroES
MEFRLQAILNRVIVKPIVSEEKTEAGIIIPESQKGAANRAEVMSVGPGYNKEGMQVEVGDIVMFAQYAGQDLDLRHLYGETKDMTYKCLDQGDIFGIERPAKDGESA